MTKKEVRKQTRKLIRQSAENMRKNLERALICGAIDFDKDYGGTMILPKTMLLALLKEECNQYSCSGTSFEKQIKKDAQNIYICI